MKNLINWEVLTKTMDNLPVGVGVFKVENKDDLKSIRYIFMNKIILHEMRKNREEVFGKFIIDVAPEAYEHEIGLQVIETYRDVSVNGGSVNLGEVNYSNEEVAGTYECSVHHIKDNYVYVLLNNITELKNSRRKLAQLNANLEKEVEKRTKELVIKNKELEQFAFIASHDLQEPLRTINSFVELLEKQCKGEFDDMTDKYLHYISQASTRMSALVKGLLDYSQLGRENQKNDVDCNALIKAVQDDLAAMISKTNTKLEIDELPFIKGHKTELRLLFQNLLTNAIKFHKKDAAPNVKISAQKENHFWKISFQDNGIGISPEHKEKIFVIYQRLHGKSEYEGTGIGLAQCQKIVDLHGGKIWVDSQPDKGSTFYITFPI